MFLVSTPILVRAACAAGVIGTFPTSNARSADELAAWLDDVSAPHPTQAAPYGVNLIVHRSNDRLGADRELCARARVPLVITSLGIDEDLVRAIHGWGGIVFHDVTTRRHAERAIRAGVDGLVLVSAGAGGHAGQINPFAFVGEIRAIFSGTIVLAGAIGDGRAMAAARLLGADLVYMGSRFIATAESGASADYKAMLLTGDAASVIYTDAFSPVPASFLKASIHAAGIDPEMLRQAAKAAAGPILPERVKLWRDIWSAGQGIGAIGDIPTVAELCRRIEAEYRQALADATARTRELGV